MIKAIFLDSISDLFFQIFFIFSLFLNFEDIFKKCEFLYVSDLKRAKIWKYFEKVWVPVHYCSYIYQQGTYKISHQVIFDKFWLLLWKGASSCMFLALLLLTWNIQEHTLFGEKVWVLVCSCQTHIDCRNIQELTPFHKKFSEKVWVPVHSWPIIVILYLSWSLWKELKNCHQCIPKESGSPACNISKVCTTTT